MREQGLRCQRALSVTSTQNSKMCFLLWREWVHRAARLIHSSCSRCLSSTWYEAPGASYSNPLLLTPSQRETTGRHSPPEKRTGLQSSTALGSAQVPPHMTSAGQVCRPQQTTTLHSQGKEGTPRTSTSREIKVIKVLWEPDHGSLCLSLRFSFASLSPGRPIHWGTKSVKFRESLK